MLIRTALAAALLASSGPAAAQHAPRQPTGKWVAEFADQNCFLSRAYGTEKNELMLAFEQFPMSAGISIYVLKRGIRRGLNSGSTPVSFGEGEPVPAKFGASTNAKTLLRRINITVEDASYKTAVVTELVSVDIPGEVTENFAVPNLKSALDILEQCAVHLGEQWGWPAEVQKRLAKPAKAIKPLVELFEASDYPVEALRKETSGRVQVRIEVDERGYPTNCALIAPSGSDALDRETCRILLKRARYEPAKDIDGEPIKTIDVATIVWLVSG